MYKIKEVSFDAVLVEFDEVDLRVLYRNYEILKNFFDVTPSYNSILIKDLDRKIDIDYIKSLISFDVADIKRELKIVPAFYNGEDLEYLASFHSLSIKEIIKRHSNRIYDVYAIGFLPGFAYMGFVDIITPRRAPRVVKKGSIAIADRQTGIYPRDSLGGWHIIAHTYIELFDGESFFKVGDRVKFEPITKEEFIRRGGVD